MTQLKWETLQNLVDLDIELIEDEDEIEIPLSRSGKISRCSALWYHSVPTLYNPYYIATLTPTSLNKNLRSLAIVGPRIRLNTEEINSIQNEFGFPELKYFHGAGDNWDANAFKYCCANSPKLEKIYFYGDIVSKKDYKSQGSTESQNLVRPSLIFWNFYDRPSLVRRSLIKAFQIQ